VGRGIMVKVMPIIYLIYMFISFYFLSFFLILYFKNRRRFFEFPKPKKNYTVSFVVPAYNEEKTIGGTVKKIFEIDYPEILEVIVVNDCSKDNTRQVLEKLQKSYPKLKVINNKKNTGCAAGAQNIGLKKARGELVAVVDADSFPAGDSLKKMIGYFDDPKVGAVTCPVLVRNKNRFWEKLQDIEYKVISFSRKLLEFIDAIYVTPGPLALYRRKALLDIGGFDEKNLTQDIEATWNLTYKKWDRKMSLPTYVTSEVPYKFREWFTQRRRWNIGGLQCIKKYGKKFGRGGMLGYFIVPFFIVNLFFGLLGLFIFLYIFFRNALSRFLFAQYSIAAGTPLLTLEDFYITPSFLNYLGIVLFVVEIIFILVVLAILKEKILKKENILNIPFYLFIYLILYPVILAESIYQYFKGHRAWR
jgi:cellulose synthase/poly-beta-1,6-N-acetylglucosamine synthase-like glycosyltransferase